MPETDPVKNILQKFSNLEGNPSVQEHIKKFGRNLFVLEQWPQKSDLFVMVYDDKVMFTSEMLTTDHETSTFGYATIKAINTMIPPLYYYIEDTIKRFGLSESERTILYAYVAMLGARMKMAPFFYNVGEFVSLNDVPKYQNSNKSLVLAFDVFTTILFFCGYNGDIGEVYTKKTYDKSVMDAFIAAANRELSISEAAAKTLVKQVPNNKPMNLVEFLAVFAAWMYRNVSKAEKIENLPRDAFLRATNVILKANSAYSPAKVVEFDSTSPIDAKYYNIPVALCRKQSDSWRKSGKSIFANIIK